MAKKEKEIKTNVMRLLDGASVSYSHYCYVDTGAVNGVDVANAMGQPVHKVFKTLVTEAPSKQHYVFVIPVAEELDLKKLCNFIIIKMNILWIRKFSFSKPKFWMPEIFFFLIYFFILNLICKNTQESNFISNLQVF